jgi:serine/threonine protein kinase/outer membrane protein OmpA-like peptidoglycan-associated protein
MQEVDARAILGVEGEASRAEIELAYRTRVKQVREIFLKAKDRRTKTQLEREFAALEEAYRWLLESEETGGAESAAESGFESGFGDRFEMKRELGNQITGTVWLADDHRLQQQVVLKFLPDELLGDQNIFEELRNELDARVELRHPNLGRIYGLIQGGRGVAVSMEYIDGPSLLQLRLSKPNQVFEADELEPWVRELCHALEHLHQEARLIHGGIKPDHLIINPAGSLQLTDLGLERLISDSLVRLIGGSKTDQTLAYCSPQQAAWEKPAIADDVYSLGATLYELLTSTPPFYKGDILFQIEEKKPALMADRRGELGINGGPIPTSWEETIAACLAKEPGQRPRSALEIAQRLENVQPHSPGFPIPPGDDEAEPVDPPSTPAELVISPIEMPQSVAPINPAVEPLVPEVEPVSTPVDLVSPADPVRAPEEIAADSTYVRGLSEPVGRPMDRIEHSPPSVQPASDVRPREAAIGYPPTPKVRLPVGPPPTPVLPPKSQAKRLLNKRLLLVLSGLLFFLALGFLITAFWFRSALVPETENRMKQRSPEPTAQPSVSASTEQATRSPTTTGSPIATTTASPIASLGGSPTENPTAQAETSASPEQTEGTNEVNASPTPLTSPEIDATKAEVIARINAVPGYSAEAKENLIKKMEEARSMERLCVVRFAIGKATLRKPAADALARIFDTPRMRDKLKDEMIILVVAGYADAGGRPDLNLSLSRERAADVTRILKRRLKLTNAMQTVGMGGTELLGSKRPDQNRAVEIWAVIPL